MSTSYTLCSALVVNRDRVSLGLSRSVAVISYDFDRFISLTVALINSPII